MTAERLAELEAIAGSVSRETLAKLLEFEQLFTKWAARINLVSPSTLTNVWDRHILDSAQLARLDSTSLRWLDIGSGGGFPGAVMAILLRDRQGGAIDLVESNRKKAAFLQTSLAGLGAPAKVHAVRIERLYDALDTPDVVTARAVAPLPMLFHLCEPFLSKGARGLFHKGRDYRQEVEESIHAWSFDLVEHKSLIDREGVVLEVRNLRRRDGR